MALPEHQRRCILESRSCYRKSIKQRTACVRNGILHCANMQLYSPLTDSIENCKITLHFLSHRICVMRDAVFRQSLCLTETIYTFSVYPVVIIDGYCKNEIGILQ